MPSFQEAIDTYNELSEEDQTTFLSRLSSNRALKNHNNEIRKLEKDKLYTEIQRLKGEVKDKDSEISTLIESRDGLKNKVDNMNVTSQDAQNQAISRFEELLKNQKEDYERQIGLQNNRIQELHVESMRNRVLHKFQIPSNLAKFVIGQTEEELAAAAQTVVETFDEVKGSLLTDLKKQYNIEEGTPVPQPPGQEVPPANGAGEAPPPPPVQPPLDPLAPHQLDGVVVGTPDMSGSVSSQFTAEDIAKMTQEQYAKHRDQILLQRRTITLPNSG